MELNTFLLSRNRVYYNHCVRMSDRFITVGCSTHKISKYSYLLLAMVYGRKSFTNQFLSGVATSLRRQLKYSNFHHQIGSCTLFCSLRTFKMYTLHLYQTSTNCVNTIAKSLIKFTCFMALDSVNQETTQDNKGCRKK